MNSRWARPEDTPALQELWRRVFGDGPEVTKAFFHSFPPTRHTRVLQAEGRLASMASWIPVLLRDGEDGRPGAYIYAVATAPEHRSQGLARKLLEELERALAAEGLSFAALCPAERSLYDYYGALGYETAFFCDHFHVSAGDRPLALAPVDPEAYVDARQSLLRLPYCAWDQNALAYLRDTGTQFYRFPGGCAAVSVQPDGTMHIRELIASDVHGAAAGVCAALNAGQGEEFAPGIEQPRLMLKWFRI